MNNGLLITVAVVTIWPTGVCAQQPPQVTTSGQEQIDYPVDHLPMPCSPGACGGIQLVDLDLVARASDEASSGRIRFRLGNRAFLFGVLDTDADRNVPQLAAEASENRDSVSGSTDAGLRGAVGNTVAPGVALDPQRARGEVPRARVSLRQDP